MQRVAGIGLDGSTVTVTLGKTQIPVVSASYEDSLAPEWLMEMGAQEQDEQSDGTYSTGDVSIKFSAVRFRTQVLPALASNGFGNKRVPIVVSRSHPDLGDDSDLLEACRCTNLKAATEASATVETVETTWTTKQIRWGSERKTINRLRDVPQGDNTL